MNWRSGIVVAILAFAGGALGYGWLSSSGLSPFGADEAEAPTATATIPSAPDVVPSTAPSVPVVPQIIHPIADSERTEAMLVTMAARRAIDSGVPLGDLVPRLQRAFGISHPDELARVLAAGKEKLTVARLLTDFDTLAPMMQREPELTWQGMRDEMASLFVIRRAGNQKPSADLQLQQARDFLASGNVEAAMRFVAQLPGAANAKGWLKNAARFVETQRALDRLEQAALSMPVNPPAPPILAPPPPLGDQPIGPQ